jgi:osmotically-inducible protein OsmY
MKRTDSQLKQAVLQELKWDTHVDETEVGVELQQGIVTLTGTVDSWAKRLAAQRAAHRVEGVLDVANEIQVRTPGSPGRTDTDIAEAVRRALEWDVFVPHKRVASTVSDGLVTLEGKVDSFREREDAEQAIRNLAGVRAVTNRIEVVPSVAPFDVKRAISEALERHADRTAARIAIEASDGHVRLSGVVHSYGEKAAAVGAAKGTLGVRSVDDQLRIEPQSV